MIQTQGRATFSIFGFLFFSLFAIGCTTIIDFPSTTVVEHPASQKFNLKVQLLITQPLLDSKWEDGRGNERIILLGEPFSQNAEHLTRLLFTDIVVSRPTDPHQNAEVDAILTPKLVSLKKSRTLAGFDMQTTAIFEWRLTGLDHNIIWVKSITSKVLSEMGGLGNLKSSDRKHVTLLLTDLFKKSFEAMSSSPEIIEFSQSRHNYPT